MSKTEINYAEIIESLTARVAALEAKLAEKPKSDSTEMTDQHAYDVTYGELSALKHKDAAEKLGLTYGQVYSARGEFTFKQVHKKAKEEGKKNAWVK